MPDVSHQNFKSMLEHQAKSHPYLLFPDFLDIPASPRVETKNKRSLVRFLPQKALWHVSELFVFEGDEFIDAATLALRNRLATPEEKERLIKDLRPGAKLWFIFELDNENRKERSNTRVYGDFVAFALWSITSKLFSLKFNSIAKPFRSYFRMRANYIYKKSQINASFYLLLFKCLDGLDK